MMRRTFLAAAVAAPLAAWALLRTKVARAVGIPPSGVQPNGNLVAQGPNSQVHVYGDDAGINTWCVMDQLDGANFGRESYWSATAEIGTTRKIMSISTHPYKSAMDDWGGVLRLNVTGTLEDAWNGLGFADDIFLRGWAHEGAAMWYYTSEIYPPGRQKMYIGGQLILEDWLRGEGASAVEFWSGHRVAGSVSLSGHAFGEGEDLVMLAQADRKIVLVPDGDPSKRLEVRDGDIYRPGDTVGLFARVAALGG